HTCNACNVTVKQTEKAGYRNLINKFASKQSGYEEVVRQCISEKRRDLLVDQHALSTHQWVNLVINKIFTFTAVDDVVVRSAVKYSCRRDHRTVDSIGG
ncbi:hypothetical protein JG688_00009047, partial [Phytophthora aleatoria]